MYVQLRVNFDVVTEIFKAIEETKEGELNIQLQPEGDFWNIENLYSSLYGHNNDARIFVHLEIESAIEDGYLKIEWR